MNNRDIYCSGRAACAGGMINNIGNDTDDGSTRCWASRSCQSLSLLTGGMKLAGMIRGYLGAAWTKMIDVPFLACVGEAACYSVSNTTSYELICSGFRSCAELTGTDNYRVKAYGTLSLENSILHNPSHVVLGGFYAGYNATIYCDHDKTCNITCNSHACVNLSLICGSIDNATICNNITNSMYSVSCNTSQGIICPNGWGNNYDNSDPSASYALLEKILNIFNYTSDLNSKIKYVKNLDYSECNIYADDYDDDYDDYDLSWASSINYNYTSSNDNNNLKCSDSWQCENDLIINKNNVCCHGVDSCLNASIISFNNLFCDSSGGCNFITANATNTNGDIYLRGRRTAQHEGTIISNFGSMMIGTSRGVANDGSVFNGVNLVILGYFGVYESTITGVSNIYAAGSGALYSTTINSGGIGEMNIYFLGYESGSGARITCNGDDVCNIYCLTDDACDEISVLGCDADVACTINLVDGIATSTNGVFMLYLIFEKK